MDKILCSPTFWLCISIFSFSIGQWIQRKTNSPFAQPLILATIMVFLVMYLTDTSLDTYNASGGAFIALFLTPATVSLAVPIYHKLDILKANFLPIIAGTLVGSVVSIVSVFALCKLFGLSESTTMSLLPKSVTTPIGISLSDMFGGIPAITTLSISITGITGTIALPFFLKLIGAKDPVQIGLSIGTASHALGTTRAIELGETEGAMSGLAIGIAGIITAIIVSIIGPFLLAA